MRGGGDKRFMIDDWILDSGCSHHMTPNKHLLIDTNVLLGDDSSCDIIGTGSVVLTLSNGSEYKLCDVKYVPKLKRNLISLGCLKQDGVHIKLCRGKMKMIKGALTVMQGTKKNNNIYVLDGVVQSCLITSNNIYVLDGVV